MYGSNVGNPFLDWNVLESVVLVLQFILAFGILVLNCFADRAPDYMDIKGKRENNMSPFNRTRFFSLPEQIINPSPEKRVSWFNRLVCTLLLVQHFFVSNRFLLPAVLLVRLHGVARPQARHRRGHAVGPKQGGLGLPPPPAVAETVVEPHRKVHTTLLNKRIRK